jgi:hypothetical protein
MGVKDVWQGGTRDDQGEPPPGMYLRRICITCGKKGPCGQHPVYNEVRQYARLPLRKLRAGDGRQPFEDSQFDGSE